MCAGFNVRLCAKIFVVSLFTLGCWVNVQAAKPPVTIAEFAKCSRQCTQENKQCQQKRVNKCKSTDSECLESCDAEYPVCMAKCPKPGS